MKRSRDGDDDEEVQELEPSQKRLKLDDDAEVEDEMEDEDRNQHIPVPQNIQIFVNSLQGTTLTLTIPRDYEIESLYNDLSTKTGIRASELRVIYAGKQLLRRMNNSDNGRLMNIQDYGIINLSTLFIVVRMRGGVIIKVKTRIESSGTDYEIEIDPKETILELKKAINIKTGDTLGIYGINLMFKSATLSNAQTMDHYDIVDGSRVTIGKRLNVDRNTGVKLSPKGCMFTLSDDDDDPRALLSCGHAATPSGLTAYCRSIFTEKMQYRFTCPHEDRSKHTTDPTRYCRKVWPWKEIRKIAQLTPEEIQFFENRSVLNMMRAEGDVYRQCPGCKTHCFREENEKNMKRFICGVCDHEFCFSCLKAWKSPGVESCGNYECSLEGVVSILQSFKNEKVRIPYVDLLTFQHRACVWCGTLIEWVSECKHMTCIGCKMEFCFCCLKKRNQVSGTWGCGEYVDKCIVAPIQNLQNLQQIEKERMERERIGERDEDEDDDDDDGNNNLNEINGVIVID